MLWGNTVISPISQKEQRDFLKDKGCNIFIDKSTSVKFSYFVRDKNDIISRTEMEMTWESYPLFLPIERGQFLRYDTREPENYLLTSYKFDDPLHAHKNGILLQRFR